MQHTHKGKRGLQLSLLYGAAEAAFLKEERCRSQEWKRSSLSWARGWRADLQGAPWCGAGPTWSLTARLNLKTCQLVEDAEFLLQQCMSPTVFFKSSTWQLRMQLSFHCARVVFLSKFGQAHAWAQVSPRLLWKQWIHGRGCVQTANQSTLGSDYGTVTAIRADPPARD